MEDVSSSKEALPKASSRRKRKRRTSETNHSKSHAPKHSYHPPPHKRARAIVSTTAGANNIMKFRLGGSVSDPLNLEDDHVMSGDPEPCGGQPSPLPPAMAKDPLNLDDRRQHSRRDGEGEVVGGACDYAHTVDCYLIFCEGFFLLISC